MADIAGDLEDVNKISIILGRVIEDRGESVLFLNQGGKREEVKVLTRNPSFVYVIDKGGNHLHLWL